MNLYGLAAETAAEFAVGALDKVRLGELHSLGEVSSYVRSGMGSIFDALLPSAKQEFAALIEPATQKAVEAIKPAMYDVLRDWTPSFAAISGGMMALAVLLGIWISKRTFISARRRAA